MRDESRPSPEEFLERIRAEGRGELRVYLGAAPGVGKTFTMLQDARLLREHGVDVVVGIIDTHKRADTAALLDGFEQVPLERQQYRGIWVEELDVPALLERHPDVALIDELAHSNLPGAKHAKRYEDVEDVLQAGITVWTTVNIQHIESLNDVVKQVTGVRVRETVPDRVVREADEVRLIDLTPDELIDRLKQGKVYQPHVIPHALKNFFRAGNLSALREMSLRVVADSTDDQLETYMDEHGISGPWPVNDRVLVCITPSPSGDRLIRRGARRAQRLKAELYVVFVRQRMLSVAEEKQLAIHVQLSRQLEAKVVELKGDHVAETLLDFAREHHITEIIMGKSRRSRWDEMRHGSVITKVLRGAGHIDVMVVAPDEPS